MAKLSTEVYKQKCSESLNLMVEMSKGMVKISVRKTIKKQPSRGVIKKRCSENMQQIYRRTPIPKYDFNKLLCNFLKTTL